MPRIPRIDIGGYVYHVINRANARVQIFDDNEDYQLFEKTLERGMEKFNMRLLAYCIMPNHWHLVLFPYNDGDLSSFMGWLTNAHTRRWHTIKGTVGQGHLYQGRYKSFLCQEDEHLLSLLRYVESNAKRADLVPRAEDWSWSSVWRRKNDKQEQKKILSPWPISEPKDYLVLLNEPQSRKELDIIRQSVARSNPYGRHAWAQRITGKFGIESTLRSIGRPRKGG